MIMNKLDGKIHLYELKEIIQNAIHILSDNYTDEVFKHTFRVMTKAFKQLSLRSTNYPNYYLDTIKRESNNYITHYKKASYDTLIYIFEFSPIYTNWDYNFDKLKYIIPEVGNKPFPKIIPGLLNCGPQYNNKPSLKELLKLKTMDYLLPKTGKYTVINQLIEYYSKTKPSEGYTQEEIAEQVAIAKATKWINKELYGDSIQTK